MVAEREADAALQAVRRETAALDAEPEPKAAASRPGTAAPEAPLGMVAAALLKVCPLDGAGDAQRRAWAVALEAAVLSRHRSSTKEVKTHVRNLKNNLRSNGACLARYDPIELAALSNEQLGEDLKQDRLREATGRSWRAEQPWSGSYADPPPVISDDSAWRTASGRRRLVLATRGIDTEANAALQYYFKEVPGVEIAIGGSILAQEGVVDAFISPANTMGNMDGGIDKVYAEHFGWSPGRPYQDANPLQLAMDEKYGRKQAEVPIGESVIAPVEPLDESRTVRFLIAAPTMMTPGAIPIGSRVVYDASRAAFRAWRGSDGLIEAAACPMFGTGWGEVPAWVAAAQMWEAFVVAWA